MSALAPDDILGWVGLAKTRNRVAEQSAYVAAGVLFGAATALLFAPDSGENLRTRLGRRIGGQLGRRVGERAGGHPVTTVRFYRRARELLGMK